jgi:hypothetical protein
VASDSLQGVFSENFSIASFPIGVQWNPLARDPSSSIKPFLATTVGPVIGSSSRLTPAAPGPVVSKTLETTVGGHVGGGIDFHLGRPFAIGIIGGYNWMVPFSKPVGMSDNHSGGEFAVSIGFLFGKGR